MDKFQSLPNIRTPTTSLGDLRRLYSMSLSHLRSQSALSISSRDYNYKPSPFSLRWIYGYNATVGVINLTDNTTTAFYAATNCAVLYNWTTHHMKIMQGHRHMVICIAADSQGKWLVTADSGPENCIIIWDSADYFPQRTIFTPHGNVKLAKVALSADAKYLLTLAYPDKAVLHWWIWSFGLNEPHASLQIEINRGLVVDMGFNPYNSTQFLVLTKHDIWIGASSKIFVTERGILKETDDYQLNIRSPEKKSTDVGKFTCFTFVKGTSQVLVGTNRGTVLVYGYTIEYQENVSSSNYENLRFVKVLKVQTKRINVIKSVDGFIVIGNNAGEIHFYDEHMMLVYWVHGFRPDSVTGISFNILPRSYQILDPKCNKVCPCIKQMAPEIDSVTGETRQKLMKKDLALDATTDNKPFILRDFIVCTKNEGVGFVDFLTEKLTTIIDSRVFDALSIDVHPEKSFICVGFANGTLEMHNYVHHKIFARLDLRDHYKVVIPPDDHSINCNFEVRTPQFSVTCLKYSPSGLHLACGLDTGELLFLHPTTIEIVTKTFKDTSYAVQEICYSEDSLTLAMADIGRTVCVYKYDCQEFKWHFVGKHRAHYKDISALFFLPKKNESGEFKLVSLGIDRIMVEYDIGPDYVEILSLDRVEQSAVPIAGIPWPTSPEVSPGERTDLPMILMANNEHKYKIVNYATTMTLCTTLGPRYDHPVRQMRLVTRSEGDKLQYLLFATKDVIGLQKMPLDGNPWKHAGLLGHPIEVKSMCFKEDSGTLLTIGSGDTCICQWTANYRSVETTTKMGGGDLDPYYCLIENGRPGYLFSEIRNLFYYIQILCQGTFSPAVRRVKDYIPIDSLPDLMRALGFFPSEYEVENLIVEAKHKVYQRTASTEVDFEEFVKLYLNHRPAFSESCRRIRKAFANFANIEDDNYVMYREDFVDMLCNNGECFSRELASYLLSILYGHSIEDRAALMEADFSFLPEKISFSELMTKILGVQDVEYLSELSAKDSQGTCVTSDTDDDGK